MKIKTKKQLNLPQLIEWVIENKKFNTMFNSDKCNIVLVSDRGTIEFTGLFYDDTFTVEVEEEITEDTVIPRMLTLGRYDGWDEFSNHKLSDFNLNLLSAYIINDDLTMTLIWTQEKGMME